MNSGRPDSFWKAISALEFCGVTQKSWDDIAGLGLPEVVQIARSFPNHSLFTTCDGRHLVDPMTIRGHTMDYRHWSLLFRRQALHTGALLGMDTCETPVCTPSLFKVSYGGWSLEEILQAGSRLGLQEPGWEWLLGQSIVSQRSPIGMYELEIDADCPLAADAPVEIVLAGMLAAKKAGWSFPEVWVRCVDPTLPTGNIAVMATAQKVEIASVHRTQNADVANARMKRISS